jgi:hypothetical protein
VLWRQGNHPALGRPQGHPDHCSRVTPRDRRDARPPSPTVPERRRTAGSGPAAAIPTMLGVSISQHCPGRRLDPTWEPWPSSERSTGPATPSTPCSINQVVAEHLEAFLGAAAEAGDGAGLPQFVEREFR